MNLEALPFELLSSQTAHKFLKEKLIAGYRQCTQGLPKYEQREPDIEFNAKLEKHSAQHTVIGELRDKNGDVYTDNANLINIVTAFYTDLYTPSPVEETVQEKLLGKRVLDPSEEKLFYNPIFQGRSERTLKITKHCETAGVFAYGQI